MQEQSFCNQSALDALRPLHTPTKAEEIGMIRPLASKGRSPSELKCSSKTQLHSIPVKGEWKNMR